ncbi:MAG: acyl-[acyl-carrier-protein]--UDP-N-acetylglucosamine O-acyltransferase, partial [Candidatus Cloacimonetes bacterium]|nr:acyl-[acyl-carrier-protein]--UDP-N-acetylglucosamine O-acyltransferase [Candidatus Cloacimonadota bacterium]
MIIHPTAIIGKEVKLAENVEIGPYCILDGKVSIGEGTRLISNVRIESETIIGKNNTFFHSAVIGTAPQDLKYKGEPTKLIIGDNNTIREFVTINRSATMDEDVVIGNGCLLK